MNVAIAGYCGVNSDILQTRYNVVKRTEPIICQVTRMADIINKCWQQAREARPPVTEEDKHAKFNIRVHSALQATRGYAENQSSNIKSLKLFKQINITK